MNLHHKYRKVPTKDRVSVSILDISEIELPFTVFNVALRLKIGLQEGDLTIRNLEL